MHNRVITVDFFEFTSKYFLFDMVSRGNLMKVVQRENIGTLVNKPSFTKFEKRLLAAFFLWTERSGCKALILPDIFTSSSIHFI